MLYSKDNLSALAYFDIFDFPLTRLELEMWSYQNDGQPADALAGLIEEKNGFYFLPGRGEIIQKRLEKYQIADKKFKKAIRMAKIFRFIPFIKLIAVCNRLGYSNAEENSDIDLFIICQKNHIWKTRFWLSGFLKLFKLRPTDQVVKDKFCASFFLSEDNLDIKNLSIGDDIYLKYWLAQIYPIYDTGIYHEFLEANSWVKKDIPNCIPVEPSGRRRIKIIKPKLILRLIFSIFTENFCRKYQLKILPKNLKEIVNKDTRVVMNDKTLKFHDNDKRAMFRDLFKRNLAKLP